MIRDARINSDVPRPSPILGVHGVLGSMFIHLMLLATVVSYDAYLRSRQAAPAGEDVNAATTAGDPTSGSAAIVRAGQAGFEAAHAIPLPEPLASMVSASVESVQRVADRLTLALSLGTLSDHLWQSTAFAIAAALLTLAFRRHRARVRYWLWFSASIKFLVPFTPLVVLGSQLAWPASIRSIANHPIVAGIGEPLGHVNASVAAMLPAASGASSRDWLGLALLVIWATGFITIVSIRALAWRRLGALVDASKPLDLPDVEIPADVVVRSVPGLLEPGVIGWQRPVLLMPADIADHLTPREIAAIVAHELCHVRRHDNLTASFHMLAEALFWFHPAVWWIGARLVDERERACDEHVLTTVGEPQSYARGILNICKRYVASPLASVSGVSSSNVKKRIDAILSNHVGEAIGPWQKVILGTTMALVLVVPLGAGAIYAPRFAGQFQEMVFVPRTDGAARPGRSGAASAATARYTERVDVSATIISYALVVASPNRRLGPRLTRSSSTECDAAANAAGRCGVVGRVGHGEISATGVTSAELARAISLAIDRQVEDHTGLTGRFTAQITWTPEPGELSMFTAVREQLGLTLVPLGMADRAARASTTAPPAIPAAPARPVRPATPD